MVSIPKINRVLTAIYRTSIDTGAPMVAACAECAKRDGTHLTRDQWGIVGLVCDACARVRVADLEFDLVGHERAIFLEPGGAS